MSTIVLRSVKGSPLSNAEVDSNFSNLNTDKLEAATSATLTNKTINLTSNTLVATSAQLAAAVTDETGTGALVFANSPTLVTPALGTPSSGTVTNLTGTASININGTVGATTASTGAFTTLSATGVTTVQAGTAAAPAITTSGDTNTGIFFPAADTIAFTEGGAESMRVDSSGNLGLGVTPSAFGNGFKSLQVNGPAIYSNGFNNLNFATNVSGGVDGSGNGGLYNGNDAAARYQQLQGTHRWFNAPSGTAGNAITFTQAMTLDASGNLLVGTATNTAVGNTNFVLNNANSTGVSYNIGGVSTVVAYTDVTQYITGTQTNIPYIFRINATEQMRLTSTGLGIGTSSPAYKLTVAVPLANAVNSVAGRIGLNNGSYSASIYAYQEFFGDTLGLGFTTVVAGTETQKMYLDSSGNLGLGVTPTNNTLGRTLQVGQAGAWVAESGTNRWWLANNWYFNSGDKYINNGFATLYSQQNGTHQWQIAPSGTAGNAISFSQVMTLDASGNLLVGTTVAPNANAKIRSSTGIQYNNSVLLDVSNPNGKVFTITGGSNGSSTFVEVEILTFEGYFKAVYFCINSGGSWENDKYNEITSGTPATVTVAGNNTATLTLTVACTTSFTPLMRVAMGSNLVSIS